MAFQFKKNLSLIATFGVIAITAVVGYYVIGLKKAPYSVANLESFTCKWGTSNHFVNSYSSITGDYFYLSNRDSLIKTNIKLRSNELIFIHNKINELGFWNLPSIIGTKKPNSNAPIYEVQFNYKERSKKLTIYSDFEENPLLLDSAMHVVTTVQQVIDEAESRYHHK